MERWNPKDGDLYLNMVDKIHQTGEDMQECFGIRDAQTPIRDRQKNIWSTLGSTWKQPEKSWDMRYRFYHAAEQTDQWNQ